MADEFPTEAQVTSFLARAARIDSISAVPIRRAPDSVTYREIQQPRAPTMFGVVAAKTIEEELADPTPAPPPAPPPPSEAELRQVLAQAVLALRAARDSEAHAVAVAERGARHVEACRVRLAGFGDLEREAAEEVLASLQNPDIARVETSEAMQRRLAERDLAKADMAAASRASATLTETVEDARRDTATADRAAEAAAVAVVALRAEELATRVVTAEAEALRLRELLSGFNAISPHRHPPTVRQLFGTGERFLQPTPGEPWKAAMDALLQDAQVAVLPSEMVFAEE